jgi:hypothetical protein
VSRRYLLEDMAAVIYQYGFSAVNPWWLAVVWWHYAYEWGGQDGSDHVN